MYREKTTWMGERERNSTYLMLHPDVHNGLVYYQIQNSFDNSVDIDALKTRFTRYTYMLTTEYMRLPELP